LTHHSANRAISYLPSDLSATVAAAVAAFAGRAKQCVGNWSMTEVELSTFAVAAIGAVARIRQLFRTTVMLAQS